MADLYLYDLDPSTLRDTVVVFRLRDEKQTIEVDIAVDHRMAQRIVDDHPTGFPVGEITLQYEPWQVISQRKIDWHEYRRGMPAGND